nr:hypothetical protein [Haladaptatus sp. R4]
MTAYAMFVSGVIVFVSMRETHPTLGEYERPRTAERNSVSDE